MTLEPTIKRWTAKRKSELVMQIFAGQITVAEASRRYDLLQRDIEQWLEDAKAGMENSLRAKPKDVTE
ncbi:transposase, partial [Oligella urethralis]